MHMRQRLRRCRLLGTGQYGRVHCAVPVGSRVALCDATDQPAAAANNDDNGTDNDHTSAEADTIADATANAAAVGMRRLPGCARARHFRSHQLDELVPVLRGQLLWIFAGLHHKLSILRAGAWWNLHTLHGGVCRGNSDAGTTATAAALTATSFA